MPMKWKPAPQALVDRFSEIVPDDPRIERRKMFGYPCAFAGGNMFMGLFQDQLILRLGAADRAEMVSREGALPFQPMGRPMREYVSVPPALIADDGRIGAWIKRSFAWAASLPGKAPKKKGGGKRVAKARAAPKKSGARKAGGTGRALAKPARAESAAKPKAREAAQRARKP